MPANEIPPWPNAALAIISIAGGCLNFTWAPQPVFGLGLLGIARENRSSVSNAVAIRNERRDPQTPSSLFVVTQKRNEISLSDVLIAD